MTTNLQAFDRGRVASAPENPFSTAWLAQLRRGLGTMDGRPALMAGFQVTTTQAREIEEAAWFAPDALPEGTSPATRRRIAAYQGGVIESDRW